MERTPTSLMKEEIVKRLDVESLFCLGSVNRTLRQLVWSSSSSSSSKHLELPPYLCPDPLTLHRIITRFSSSSSSSSSFSAEHPTSNNNNINNNSKLELEGLTILNCQRLLDFHLTSFLAHLSPLHLRHLHLGCCSLLSPRFLSSSISPFCPFLRVLVLELVHPGLPSHQSFQHPLASMLSSSLCLECLSLKVRGTGLNPDVFLPIDFVLPTTIKTIKLNPLLVEDAIHLTECLRVGPSVNHVTPMFCGSYTLQCLSLVLDLISDKLLVTITSSLPLLVELELEDRPEKEPMPSFDLTNVGLQSLASCHCLTSLAFVRSRKNFQGSFKRVNDMGMFLLSESCKGLTSLRFGGFSKVTDAGFASFLRNCQNLQKFEVRSALLLSDLAFHDLIESHSALVEVRLLSCSLITSETVNILSFSTSLEVLDLSSCKSVADSCLNSISCLTRLKTLNLTGADITNGGLSLLGQGSAPITHLYLRACKRINDKGISLLLQGGGVIRKTLSVLDLGYMPGISDKSVHTIVAFGTQIIELSIRSCFYVTDSSFRALAAKRRIQDGSKPLRRLDVFNCIGLSADSFRLVRRPSFCGLRWIGIGQTRLASNGDVDIAAVHEDRPWLYLCLDGCELGCQDGWQFHRS